MKEKQWYKVRSVSFIVAMSTSKDLNIFLAHSFHKVLVIDDKYPSWHVLPGFWNFVFQWSNSDIVLVSLDALGDKLFCRAGEVLSHCPSNFFPNFQQEIQLKNFPVVSLLVLWSFFLYHASIWMFFFFLAFHFFLHHSDRNLFTLVVFLSCNTNSCQLFQKHISL